MGSEDPIPIGVFASRVNQDSSLHIPDSKGPVFTVGDQELHAWVEHDTGYVVHVALESVHLPVLVARKSPEFDGLVVSCRCHNLHGGMESYPVDTFFMALKDVLDLYFGAAVDLTRTRSLFVHELLFKLKEVPDPDGLVKTTAGNQCVFRVKRGAHHIVGVSRQDRDFAAVLPVPDAHGLVITGRYNPWKVVVELDCAHVIDVTV